LFAPDIKFLSFAPDGNMRTALDALAAEHGAGVRPPRAASRSGLSIWLVSRRVDALTHSFKHANHGTTICISSARWIATNLQHDHVHRGTTALCVQQAQSTRRYHTRRASFFPIAKCLPLPNMLHLLLLQLLTSFLCNLHRCLHQHAAWCPSGGDKNGRGGAAACARQARCSSSRSAPPRTAATVATADTASAAAVSPQPNSVTAAKFAAAATDSAAAADSAEAVQMPPLPSRPRGLPSAAVGAAAIAAGAVGKP
jgi:hypothetical protein